jgi:hypothetical protein
MRLDSEGQPQKTEVEVFEIIRDEKPWRTYRRLVSKNGVPVTRHEVEKQDREHRKRVEQIERKRSKRTNQELTEEDAATLRQEQDVIEDLFGVYQFRIAGRETIDGHPAIRITFQPRRGYQPKTKQGKNMLHIAGQAWISENDYQLARIEAEVVEPFSIGFGLLAKLQRGTRIRAERRKFNNEIWLPVKTEVSANARIFLLKGLTIREIREFSDHKRLNVDTILTFQDADK